MSQLLSIWHALTGRHFKWLADDLSGEGHVAVDFLPLDAPEKVSLGYAGKLKQSSKARVIKVLAYVDSDQELTTPVPYPANVIPIAQAKAKSAIPMLSVLRTDSAYRSQKTVVARV